MLATQNEYICWNILNKIEGTVADRHLKKLFNHQSGGTSQLYDQFTRHLNQGELSDAQDLLYDLETYLLELDHSTINDELKDSVKAYFGIENLDKLTRNYINRVDGDQTIRGFILNKIPNALRKQKLLNSNKENKFASAATNELLETFHRDSPHTYLPDRHVFNSLTTKIKETTGMKIDINQDLAGKLDFSQLDETKLQKLNDELGANQVQIPFEYGSKEGSVVSSTIQVDSVSKLQYAYTQKIYDNLVAKLDNKLGLGKNHELMRNVVESFENHVSKMSDHFDGSQLRWIESAANDAAAHITELHHFVDAVDNIANKLVNLDKFDKIDSTDQAYDLIKKYSSFGEGKHSFDGIVAIPNKHLLSDTATHSRATIFVNEVKIANHNVNLRPRDGDDYILNHGVDYQTKVGGIARGEENILNSMKESGATVDELEVIINTIYDDLGKQMRIAQFMEGFDDASKNLGVIWDANNNEFVKIPEITAGDIDGSTIEINDKVYDISDGDRVFPSNLVSGGTIDTDRLIDLQNGRYSTILDVEVADGITADLKYDTINFKAFKSSSGGSAFTFHKQGNLADIQLDVVKVDFGNHEFGSTEARDLADSIDLSQHSDISDNSIVVPVFQRSTDDDVITHQFREELMKQLKQNDKGEYLLSVTDSSGNQQELLLGADPDKAYARMLRLIWEQDDALGDNAITTNLAHYSTRPQNIPGGLGGYRGYVFGEGYQPNKFRLVMPIGVKRSDTIREYDAISQMIRHSLHENVDQIDIDPQVRRKILGLLEEYDNDPDLLIRDGMARAFRDQVRQFKDGADGINENLEDVLGHDWMVAYDDIDDMMVEVTDNADNAATDRVDKVNKILGDIPWSHQATTSDPVPKFKPNTKESRKIIHKVDSYDNVDVRALKGGTLYDKYGNAQGLSALGPDDIALGKEVQVLPMKRQDYVTPAIVDWDNEHIYVACCGKEDTGPRTYIRHNLFNEDGSINNKIFSSTEEYNKKANDGFVQGTESTAGIKALVFLINARRAGKYVTRMDSQTDVVSDALDAYYKNSRNNKRPVEFYRVMELINQIGEISKKATRKSEDAPAGDELLLRILKPFADTDDLYKKGLGTIGIVSTTLTRRLSRALDEIMKSGTDSQRVGFWGKVATSRGKNIVTEAMEGTEAYTKLQSTDDMLNAMKAYMYTKDQLKHSQRFERDRIFLKDLAPAHNKKDPLNELYDNVFAMLRDLYGYGKNHLDLWRAFSLDVKHTIGEMDDQAKQHLKHDIEELLDWISGLLISNKKKTLVGDANPLTDLIAILLQRVFGKTM